MEKHKFSIQYCTSCGYYQKATALKEKILNMHNNKIESFILIPSSGGVFEVYLNDVLIFSKKAQGRFPSDTEIFQKINSIIK